MLQPLAENAIIHGIANRIEGGRVRLKIYDDHETLIIQMGNDGPFVPGAREQAGIGLDNVRRRLETLFDNTASLQIETADEDWTEVTIRQPLILSPVA
jgi:LytS/YehU family sensor histidine kinase